MKYFEDASGTEWKMAISVGSAKAAVKSHKIDLLNGTPEDIALSLSNDALLRLDLVWHFVIDKDDRTQDELENVLTGAVLKESQTALLDLVAEFILATRPAVHAGFMGVMEKYKAIVSKQISSIERIVASPEVSKMVDDELAKAEKSAIESIASFAGAENDAVQ